MRRLLTPLVVALLGLWSCSGPSTQVPVVQPSPRCDPGPEPTWPTLNPVASEDDQRVTLGADEVTLLWEWRREDLRWHERARVCSDTSDSPQFFTRPAMAPAPALSQVDIAKAMRFPGVELTISWDLCGFLGDWYDPNTEVVHLCLSTALVPQMARVVTAHEVAHAVIRQLNLGFTGNEEGAADELAAVTLILLGLSEDLLETARVFNDLARHDVVMWMDTHPQLAHRARDMRCLVFGSRGDPWLFECTTTWRRAVRAWSRLLDVKP